MGWAYEMSAWFALVEGRFEDVVDAAQQGQAVAGTSSATVQLALQEAKGQARLGNPTQASAALTRGATILGELPTPSRPEHHFVFDHTKWIFYAATIYAWQGDNDRAEEHATEIIDRHTRRDGTSNAPMRTANARVDLAIVHAHRGNDLYRVLREKYRREQLTKDFHEHLTLARRALHEHRPELLD